MVRDSARVVLRSVVRDIARVVQGQCGSERYCKGSVVLRGSARVVWCGQGLVDRYAQDPQYVLQKHD